MDEVKITGSQEESLKVSKCPVCSNETHTEVTNGVHTSYNCIFCGFFSNSMQKKDTDYVKYVESTLPKLYVDCAFLNVENNLVYYPSFIDKEKYILVLQGVTRDTAKWTSYEKKVSDKMKTMSDIDPETKKEYNSFFEAINELEYNNVE